MKIAFLSPFHPFRGGIAQFSNRLYKTLTQEHEVKAYNFTTQYPSILFPGKSQFVEGKAADEVPSERVLSSINPLTYGSTILKIRHFSPDILLMRYWMPFFAPSLGTVSHWMKPHTKRIGILDNLIPHEKRIGDSVLNQYFLNQCDAFVVMSDVVENDLKKLKPNAPYIYHPHPLYDQYGEKMPKNEARKLLGIPQNKKLMLFFGLIRPYKGLDILLEAMGALDESYALVIAGESYQDFSPYQTLIQKSKYPENIYLYNQFIKDENVKTYFSAADVVVLPYKSATQSGVVSVSLHFDLPSIVTDVGGLKSYVEGNQIGMVAKEVNSSSFLECIKEFFEKNKDFSEGIAQIKQKMSWNSLAKSILELNEQIR
jgi:glycosyltransferase involved in cell wall biosynthesis